MKLFDIYEPGQTPLPHEDTAAIGIDLGTTHSLCAISRDGAAQVIADANGEKLIPSIVHYRADGGVEIGTAARMRQKAGEPNVISSVKRLMGRGSRDAGMASLPYRIVESAGEGMARIQLSHGREVTPVEVSAEILRMLKNSAEAALGKTVDRAVITVPAYFDDAARSATKDAARLAGLEVLRLVNEPTAAALAYGLDHGSEGLYAIYDLGGGTFDLSILRMEKGIFQVIATAGDTALGGDDIDRAMVGLLCDSLNLQLADLDTQKTGMLLLDARRAKEQLSTQEETAVHYNGMQAAITRAAVETLSLPLIERSVDICRQVLIEAQLGTEALQGIILVGGATRMPLVRREIAAFFGREPLTDVDPDAVVALGAALQAEGLSEGSDNLLLDVVPLSLGLETMGGLTEKLIWRNTPIPTAVTQEFTTWQDGQDGMQIHIVQGEREMIADNRSLARFELTGIPALPAGIARVAITFTVDADGLLTVSAEERETGKKQQIEVKPSYGLSPEEMERMLRASMEHARADITGRLLAEARVEAERSIVEVESALRFDADLLEADEQTAITGQLRQLRQALTSEHRDEIDLCAQDLHRLTQDFAQRRMDRAIGSALKGQHIETLDHES